jgi:hypothetical protein
MSEKPEALRLAEELDAASLGIRACLESLSAAELRRQHADNERLKAENEALRRDAERYRWGVENARWIRHEHEAYVAIPVAVDAHLSCAAMRTAAIDAAMGEKR